MRRIITLFLALLLCVSQAYNVAATDSQAQEAAPPETHLTLGTATQMSGYFATEYWSNNATDMDIRLLLSDYDTVAFVQDHGLIYNPAVVAAHEITPVRSENQIYVVEINDGLVYSDGTPITARDYVFSLMLGIAPELAEIKGNIQRLDHIEGFDAYHTGASDTLAGLRLLSDYAFSMEIRGDFLPYFYGLELISAKPLPIAVIAPGCEVRDDGQGVYIDAAADAGEIPAEGLPYTPGVFSTDMLRETLLNPETGYVFKPRVTAGPYVLDSVDLEAQRAEFSVNPYYAGNYEGQMPGIDRLTVCFVNSEELHEALADGRIDLAHRVFHADEVKQGISDTSLGYSVYPRSGAAYLAFACEQSPGDDVSVRRAMAMALDQNRLYAETMDGIAVSVYGYYGVGQWIASFIEDQELGEGNADALEDEEKKPLADLISIPAVLDTLEVPYDVEEAARLLDEAGWVYARDGQPYATGNGNIRHRQTADGTYEPLSIRWAVTENNEIAQAIAALYAETLPGLGIELQMTELPFAKLVQHYNRQTDRVYDMFFIATDFGQVYDPYYDFHTDDEYQGLYNATGLRDEKMMHLAQDIANTDPQDEHSYAAKWIAFQQYFVQQMPMVPLYSNNYYDFFRTELQGYDPENHQSWAQAIVYCTYNAGE